MTTPDLDPNTIPDPLVEFFLEIARDMGKKLWDSTIGRGKKEIDWQIAARRYREKIIKQYDKIHVYGQARPSQLMHIFTDVNVLEKPVAMRRYDVEELQRWFLQRERRASLHAREQRMPGLDALEQADKLFILGKPGAGKTTFLKYLAVMAAGRSARLPYIPMFIDLKKYAGSGEDLLNFITRQFDICNFENAGPFIKRMLKKGKALVLFDGLDEVSAADGRRSQVIQELKDFSTKYDANKIVITCRVAATEYVFEDFAYVEMADFTPQQVERFVTNWFKDEPELGKQMLAELKESKNKGVFELAQNPLLLNLMCLIFDDRKIIPQKRSTLYEEGVDILLRDWDKTKGLQRDEIYKNWGEEQGVEKKKQFLSIIAFEFFVKNKVYIPLSDLNSRITRYLSFVYNEQTIDSISILKAISEQHGLLVEGPHRYYSFSHLSFQEYFTARYIVSYGITGIHRRYADYRSGFYPYPLENRFVNRHYYYCEYDLSSEVGEGWSVLLKHAFADRWRETFLLVISMLDDNHTRCALVRAVADKLLSSATHHELHSLLTWGKEKRLQLEKDLATKTGHLNIECVHHLYIRDKSTELIDVVFGFALGLSIARVLVHMYNFESNLGNNKSSIPGNKSQPRGNTNLEHNNLFRPAYSNRLHLDLKEKTERAIARICIYVRVASAKPYIHSPLVSHTKVSHTNLAIALIADMNRFSTRIQNFVLDDVTSYDFAFAIQSINDMIHNLEHLHDAIIGQITRSIPDLVNLYPRRPYVQNAQNWEDYAKQVEVFLGYYCSNAKELADMIESSHQNFVKSAWDIQENLDAGVFSYLENAKLIHQALDDAGASTCWQDIDVFDRRRLLQYPRKQGR